jgi:maltose alpha-D-glucosyltransferase/alpha-amylase
VITGGTYGFEHTNVADQRRDPNSFMNWTERMIRTRKETPEIGWGGFIVIPSRRDDVLILRYTWHDNSVVVIHNFSPDPIELRFRSLAKTPQNAPKAPKRTSKAANVPAAKSQPKPQPDLVLTNIISNDHSVAGPDGRHCILLEPYGYRWFRVGGQDDLLHRSNT